MTEEEFDQALDRLNKDQNQQIQDLKESFINETSSFPISFRKRIGIIENFVTRLVKHKAKILAKINKLTEELEELECDDLIPEYLEHIESIFIEGSFVREEYYRIHLDSYQHYYQDYLTTNVTVSAFATSFTLPAVYLGAVMGVEDGEVCG